LEDVREIREKFHKSQSANAARPRPPRSLTRRF
jgi:hypothetical protein